MSTVVDDEKLTSRENLIGFLFFCVQSDEDTLLKVDKVCRPNSNRFDQRISRFKFRALNSPFLAHF